MYSLRGRRGSEGTDKRDFARGVITWPSFDQDGTELDTSGEWNAYDPGLTCMSGPLDL